MKKNPMIKDMRVRTFADVAESQLKNAETAKALHLIEGGSYFTEYEGEINVCHGSDMGWWTVGAVCYKKYKKNEKEVEIVNED